MPFLRDGSLATPDHSDDLNHVAFAQHGGRVPIALNDLAVVLDGDRAGINAESVDVVEQRRRLFQLHALAVDLQRDHWNSEIAA